MILSKDDIRVRRRIMHHVTRLLHNQHPDKVEAYNLFYKEIVHDAITMVLASEAMAAEKLREVLKQEED